MPLPPQETKQEPALAISPHPFWDLVERGHGDPFIQKCVDTWFIPIVRSIDYYKTAIDICKVRRQEYQDEATLYRDLSSIASLKEREEALNRREDMARRHSLLGDAQVASTNMMAAHEKAENETSKLKNRTGQLAINQRNALIVDEFLYDLMTGKVSLAERSDRIARFLAIVALGNIHDISEHLAKDPKWLYLRLRFGNVQTSFVIPSNIALKLYPKELEDEFVKTEVEQKMLTFRPKRTETSCGRTWELLPRFQSYDLMKEWEEEQARENYRKGTVFADNYSAILVIPVSRGRRRDRVPEPPGRIRVRLPELPARVLSEAERSRFETTCREFVSEKSLDTIETALRFCAELAKPINHVRVGAGIGTVHFSGTVIRYVWSEPGEWPEAVHVRRVAAADQVQNDRDRPGVFEMKRDGALVAAVSPP